MDTFQVSMLWTSQLRLKHWFYQSTILNHVNFKSNISGDTVDLTISSASSSSYFGCIYVSIAQSNSLSVAENMLYHEFAFLDTSHWENVTGTVTGDGHWSQYATLWENGGQVVGDKKHKKNLHV